MDYRLILIIVLVIVLASLCLDCVFKEKFQAEIERINDYEEAEAEEVSPINTIDDIANLYPIIEGEDTTSNSGDENKKQQNKAPTQTVEVTNILQNDYAKHDPIGFNGIHNYTRALQW